MLYVCEHTISLPEESCVCERLVVQLDQDLAHGLRGNELSAQQLLEDNHMTGGRGRGGEMTNQITVFVATKG